MFMATLKQTNLCILSNFKIQDGGGVIAHRRLILGNKSKVRAKPFQDLTYYPRMNRIDNETVLASKDVVGQGSSLGKLTCRFDTPRWDVDRFLTLPKRCGVESSFDQSQTFRRPKGSSPALLAFALFQSRRVFWRLASPRAPTRAISTAISNVGRMATVSLLSLPCSRTPDR